MVREVQYMEGPVWLFEDLGAESHRGQGIGKALFLAVAEACATADYGRMEYKCWIGTSRRLLTNRLVPDWMRSGSMGS